MMRYLLVFLLLAGCKSGAPAVDAKSPRRFLAVSGSVLCDGQPAVVGTPIGPKASIATGAGSRAVISLQTGSAIEIRENSKLEIGSSPTKRDSVHLLVGTLWNLLPHGRADYEVIAANAVAGVRGTTFYVDATKPDATLVCVCDGEVELTPTSGKSERFATHAMHHGFAVDKTSAIHSMGVAADVESHPNATRAELEALMLH